MAAYKQSDDDEGLAAGINETSEQSSEEQVLLPENSDNATLRIPKGFGKRHLLSLLGFFGFFNVYALRVNLSVALVAMINNTAINSDSSSEVGNECPAINLGNVTKKDGEFEWDRVTQGIVLGSFFYGYIVTQIPGGWLAERFGGTKLYGFGVLTTTVLTLATPIAAKLNVWLLVAVRVLEGLGEGVTFPATHALWAKWGPPMERTKLLTFAWAGVQAGTLTSLPLSGLLCDYGFDGGWPSVFYVFGSIGLLWYVFWLWLAYDTPSKHPTISTEEKNYIEQSIGSVSKHLNSDIKTPWIKIFTSVPVYALIVAHFCNNWGFYMLLTEMPNYLKNILRFNVSQDGFLSALPYLVSWISMTSVTWFSDFSLQRGWVTRNLVRKLGNSIGFLGPAVCLSVVALVKCHHVLAVIFLILALGFAGFGYTGYSVNHLDIAPRFAGTLLGITNSVATIPGFLAPQIVGVLTENNPTLSRWSIIFFLAAGVYTFGAIVFVLFGSTKKQPWADGVTKERPGDRDAKSQHTQYVVPEQPNIAGEIS